MTRRVLKPVMLAVAGLACVAALDVASADMQAGAPASFRLAQAAATESLPAKKTKRPKVEHPKTNQLNPQPEPPMVGKKPAQGNTWLNPQPEPPRPDTVKKPQ